MKKNLLKILATMAMVVSVSACGGTKKTSEQESPSEESSSASEPAGAKTLSITQVLATTFEDGARSADYEGEEVNLKETVQFASVYDGRIFLQYYDDEDGTVYLSNVFGLEVELADGEKLPEGLAYTDKVNVSGTVHYESDNGRVILKDAKITKVGEGEKVNYYFPLERAYFDRYYNTAQYNGMNVRGQFQIADMPEEVTDEGATLKVVFPGEDIRLEDVTNEDFTNYYLMDLKIPAGLDEDQLDSINDILADTEVGGGLNGVFEIRYNKGGEFFIPEDYLGRSFSTGEEWLYVDDIAGVYYDYDDALI